jgi:hypothetical protein
VKDSFIMISTLTIAPQREGPAVSLALRNRFVTIAVESPAFDPSLRDDITNMVIRKVTSHLTSVDRGHLPIWAVCKELSDSETKRFQD